MFTSRDCESQVGLVKSSRQTLSRDIRNYRVYLQSRDRHDTFNEKIIL